jgi:cytidine deaminase
VPVEGKAGIFAKKKPKGFAGRQSSARAICGGLQLGFCGSTVAQGLRETDMTLLQAATDVRQNAYAPYSRFKVGAALRATSGAVHLGCNVENVAYPEGTCAEAGAIAAMIAAGDTAIAELVVIADSPSPVPPCGGCRQKIAEFAAPDVVVTLCTTDGKSTALTVADLLPGVFSLAHMARTSDA